MTGHTRTSAGAVLSILLLVTLCTGCNVNKWGHEAHVGEAYASRLNVMFGASFGSTVRKNFRPTDCMDAVVMANGWEIVRQKVCGKGLFLGSNWPVGYQAHGWNRGIYNICVDVVPVHHAASRTKPLDCKALIVPFDQHDNWGVDSFTIEGTAVSFTGWYSWPGDFYSLSTDLPQTTPTQVYPLIDGQGVEGDGHYVDRPDLRDRYGPAAGGVTFQTTVAPGHHQLCWGHVRVRGSRSCSLARGPDTGVRGDLSTLRRRVTRWYAELSRSLAYRTYVR